MGRLGARVLELEGQAERAARVQEELTCELETQKEELARSEAERKNSERLYREKLGQHNKLLSHLTKMRAQAGRIWEREVEPSAPRFVPLNERACPITAIMNLKGGVGKTTLAYFIARTLAGQGKRVLLVDLDHQRSLSQAFVSRRQTDALHAQERTLQHFLLSANPAPLGLLKCIEALPSPVDVSIVVSSHASDDGAGLAEAENHLQVDWVARPDSPDIRLLLRQALHGREIHDRFDHILLDCPPRFGTASVNALAASDHLLVPVNLDGSAPLAVAHFLREVKRLRVPAIFPELGLLGVVANRVILHGEDMKVDHREAWRVISGRCKTVWGEPVHMFKAKVRHSAGVGRPATEMACFEDAEGNIASFDAATAEIFTELVNEMLRRMQHASRKLPGVPAESA